MLFVAAVGFKPAFLTLMLLAGLTGLLADFYVVSVASA